MRVCSTRRSGCSKRPKQRDAELAIINSVQEGLASKLEMQAIYDLVGDKIQSIFDAQVVDIGLYDPDDKSLSLSLHHRTRRALSRRTNAGGRFSQDTSRNHASPCSSMKTCPSGSGLRQPHRHSRGSAEVLLFVPMIVGTEARGVISLQNLDHENAFTESDMRLLETFANSMSVALENARLLDETTRRVNEMTALNRHWARNFRFARFEYRPRTCDAKRGASLACEHQRRILD